MGGRRNGKRVWWNAYKSLVSSPAALTAVRSILWLSSNFLVGLTQHIRSSNHFTLCAANSEISETGSYPYLLPITRCQITTVNSLPVTGIAYTLFWVGKLTNTFFPCTNLSKHSSSSVDLLSQQSMVAISDKHLIVYYLMTLQYPWILIGVQDSLHAESAQPRKYWKVTRCFSKVVGAAEDDINKSSVSSAPKRILWYS